MNLKSTIESLLFVSGRPVSVKEFREATGRSQEEIVSALHELEKECEDSGVILLKQNDSYLLSTHPDNTQAVKDFQNAELREHLTDAAIETLAIVAYKQPVSRAEIESIRGVNSQYTLRLLLIRGLVERFSSATASRVNLYRTTHEFLQHMGLRNMRDLPDFEELTAKIKPPEGLVPDVTKKGLSPSLDEQQTTHKRSETDPEKLPR